MKTSSKKKHTTDSGLLLRLGIRSSLLLGFSAIIGVMVLSIFATFYFSTSFSSLVNEILISRLPTTVHSFRVAKAADNLATSGLSLPSISNPQERDIAFTRIDNATLALHQTLDDLNKTTHIPNLELTNLFKELENNLQQLQNIVDKHIGLQQYQVQARERLLSNQLMLQRHLLHRSRTLEGDADVILYLMDLPTPPLETIANMSLDLTKLLPVSRFYAIVENINGRLLTASHTPSLIILNRLQQELNTSLSSLDETFKKLPLELRSELEQPIQIIKDLVQNKNGLMHLRKNQLLLRNRMTILNIVNKEILERINVATSQMVENSQKEMTETANTLTTSSEKTLFALLILAIVGFLSIVALIHFYIDGQILSRLSWLSSAMQKIASGKLNITLPPAGSSELGRLSAALHQFRDITAKAKAREAELQTSNNIAKQAMQALEEKTHELEIANTRLKELSIKDALTGLFNRRYFDDSFKKEWQRASRDSTPIALLLLDIDYFKNFNDHYGHQAGDECLKEIASVLMQHARRTNDIAARYGGEEFCMIFPNTDLQTVEALASNVCNKVAALKYPNQGSPLHIVTVSVGYAVANPEPNNKDITMSMLLRNADDAMYDAKKSGRNCTQGRIISNQ